MCIRDSNIVGEPNGNGFGLALNVGPNYAPLYLDGTKNGIPVSYTHLTLPTSDLV